MEKYYRVSDVTKLLEKLVKEPYYQHDGENFFSGISAVIDELMCLEQVPDITSRTGHWIQSEEWAEDYTCSLCGNTAFKDDHGNYNVRTKYCPHCGAKMKE